MGKLILRLSASLSVIGAFLAFTSNGAGREAPVKRELVGAHSLPNVPGHELTAVTVELGPGVSVPAHRHDAFVFAYRGDR